MKYLNIGLCDEEVINILSCTFKKCVSNYQLHEEVDMNIQKNVCELRTVPLPQHHLIIIIQKSNLFELFFKLQNEFYLCPLLPMFFGRFE